MSPKRLPTFADRVVASRNAILSPADLVEHFKGRLRSARRFVFDDKATSKLADVVTNIPDLLIREQQFARAPYQITWIEFNFRLFWETVNRRVADREGDDRIGYLIDHDNVYVAAHASDKNGDLVISPFCYQLHQPWDLRDEIKFVETVGTSRGQLDTWLWGSTINNVQDGQRRDLRNHHSVRILPLSNKVPPRWLAKSYNDIFSESVGDLRNIIAILLLMNRPSLTTYSHEVKHARGFIGGKLRPYMAHHVVTISLDPKPTLLELGGSGEDRVEKRRHEVRGTYCHDELYKRGTRNGCIHAMKIHPKFENDLTRFHRNKFGDNERDNWICEHCGGQRWWREEHLRGSAEKGFVEKSYNVTA